MIVGRVPFLNCEPFYAHLDETGFPTVVAAPRPLGRMCEAGTADAGLLPVVDFFRLEDRFELLGPFCIAARAQVWSVLLLSNVAARQLHGKTVLLTDESSTSALLLRLLLEQHFGVRQPAYVREADAGAGAARADARLTIGDDALRRRSAGFPGYVNVVDLAREWWEWTALPMVFAVWAVRKSAPAEEKRALRQAFAVSLAETAASSAEIAARRAPDLGMTPAEVSTYLKHLTYRIGDLEARGLEAFRDRMEALDAAVVAR